MRNWKMAGLVTLIAGAAVVAAATRTSQAQDDDSGRPEDVFGDESFPKRLHYILPHPDGERVAYGFVDPSEELEQPIDYSHMLHAGDLGIECQYCHNSARRSIHAGIPGTHVCMNCHAMVDTKCRVGSWNDAEKKCSDKGDLPGEARPARTGGEDAGKTELDVLKEYWDTQEPIPWAKVHDLPDFVHFSHKRHVRGGVECEECHGNVAEEFTVAKRVAPLTMGWCLNCHADHPKIDENYGGEAELRRAELKDCWTCHK